LLHLLVLLLWLGLALHARAFLWWLLLLALLL
jgi:hypothetical protein